MKYEKLRNIISSILFETTYKLRSTEDFRSGQLDDKNNTIPDELPLSPEENVGFNSIVTRPPVEDDDYVPKTPLELSAAIKALSELLGNEEISKAYKEIKGVLKPGSIEESKLLEINFDDFEMPDDDTPEDFVGDDSYQGMSVVEPDDEDFKPSKSSGEASLEDLAGSGLMPGVSTASAAKAWIGRAGKKMAAIQLIDQGQMQKAKEYARDIWVGALEASESLNSEEAEALKGSDYTLTNPAFVSFFNMGFLEPALKPIKVNRDREVKKEMGSLNLAPQLENMVFSQTVGLSPVNAKKIRMKLNKAYPDMEMDEMDQMVSKISTFIRNNTEKFQKDFYKEMDFLSMAKQAWQKKSANEKMDITYAAIDDSEDFQDTAKNLGIK